MLKKLFSILAIAMMAMTTWAAEVQWTEVSTAQELKQAINASQTAKIRLTSDINVKDLEPEGDNCIFYKQQFQGTITGENSSGTDYAIIYGNTGSDMALFKSIYKANISHLRFVDFSNNVSYSYTNEFAILTITSKESNINHIAVENCNMTNKNYFLGSITAKSENDNISYCSTDGNCLFSSEGANIRVGGIVGAATTSSISYCNNAAKITGTNSVDGLGAIGGIVGYTYYYCSISNCYNAAIITGDYRTGGIVGNADYSSAIANCLNVENIVGKQYVGGIAGYVDNNSPLLKCVNTGHIDVPDNKDYIFRGGIVGNTVNSELDYCLNFGSVNHVTFPNSNDVFGLIAGNWGLDTGANNYYYCSINGTFHCKSGDENDAIFNTMWTGEYAATHLKDGQKYLYESIDNGLDNYGAKFVVGNKSYNVPVPLTGAGEVYSNILCNGTQTYSNIYHSTGEHTAQTDENHKCTVCGATDYGVEHIKNASDLTTLAYHLNNDWSGVNNRTYYLDNDIDMAGVEFTPIGKDTNHPFCGTFDGQGHRIKNLKVNVTNGCAGLFGCVSGLSAIRNLIIDSSCEINSTGYGAAGIVGCMARKEEGLRDPISLILTNCGNEAKVNGEINAAGLIGGVYNTENGGNATVTITNCYNTGNIKGSGVSHGESAVFIAYGNSSTTVKNCYNTGTIVGNWEGLSLVRVKNESTVVLRNIYNLEGVAAQNSEDCKTVTADQVRSGYLCDKLRSGENATVWTQNLEKDVVPTFGTAGLHYARTMSNAWGTVVLPFAIDYSQSNGKYKLYKLSAASVSGNTGTLTFSEYDNVTIVAGTPMAVQKLTGEGIDIAPASTPNYSKDITTQTNSNASLPAGWTMNGTYTNLTDQKNIYFIAQDKFWWAENGITIAPFRAWFTGPAPTSDNATVFNIVIDDEAENGISELKAESGKQKEGKIIENGKVVIVRNGVKYDLNGQTIH